VNIEDEDSISLPEEAITNSQDEKTPFQVKVKVRFSTWYFLTRYRSNIETSRKFLVAIPVRNFW